MTKGRVIRTISVYDESSPQHPKSIKRQRGAPSVSRMIETKSPRYSTLESQVDQTELIEYCAVVGGVNFHKLNVTIEK